MGGLSPNGAGAAVLIVTTRRGSTTGNGRCSIESAKLNIADVAPMPMAREQIATTVKPESLRRWRSNH
jgi:hypothetical protein